MTSKNIWSQGHPVRRRSKSPCLQKPSTLTSMFESQYSKAQDGYCLLLRPLHASGCISTIGWRRTCSPIFANICWSGFFSFFFAVSAYESQDRWNFFPQTNGCPKHLAYKKQGKDYMQILEIQSSVYPCNCKEEISDWVWPSWDKIANQPITRQTCNLTSSLFFWSLLSSEWGR